MQLFIISIIINIFRQVDPIRRGLNIIGNFNQMLLIIYNHSIRKQSNNFSESFDKIAILPSKDDDSFNISYLSINLAGLFFPNSYNKLGFNT